MEIGWLSLVPVLLAIILAYTIKDVFISLLSAIIVSGIILDVKTKSFFIGVNSIYKVFQENYAVKSILFCLMIGSFVYVIEASGGVHGNGTPTFPPSYTIRLIGEVKKVAPEVIKEKAKTNKALLSAANDIDKYPAMAEGNFVIYKAKGERGMVFTIISLIILPLIIGDIGIWISIILGERRRCYGRGNRQHSLSG